jgi:hypothetical protein
MADILPLFFSNLCELIWNPLALGIIQYIKGYGTPSAPCFCKDAIFLFAACLYPNIMLCNPPQHIRTLAYIDNIRVNLDAVYARVAVLVCKSLSFHPRHGVFKEVSH